MSSSFYNLQLSARESWWKWYAPKKSHEVNSALGLIYKFRDREREGEVYVMYIYTRYVNLDYINIRNEYNL